MLKKLFSFEKEKNPYLFKIACYLKSLFFKILNYFQILLTQKIDLISFFKWYGFAWMQSFSLDGRTGRAPFFAYLLGNLLIYQILSLIFLCINLDPAIALIVPFITVFPLFSLYIRRFHDRGRSTTFALIPFVFLICLIPFGLFSTVVDMFQSQSIIPWQMFFNQSTLTILLVCEFVASFCLWVVFLSLPSKLNTNQYGAVQPQASGNFVFTCEVVFVVIIALSTLFHGLFYLKKLPKIQIDSVTNKVDTLFQQPQTQSTLSLQKEIEAPVQKQQEDQKKQEISPEKHKDMIETVSLKWVPTQPSDMDALLFGDEIVYNTQSDSLSDILADVLSRETVQSQKQLNGAQKKVEEPKKHLFSQIIDDLFHNRPVKIKTNIFKQRKPHFIPNPFLTKKPEDFIVKESDANKEGLQPKVQKDIRLNYPIQSAKLNQQMNQELIADEDADITIFNASSTMAPMQQTIEQTALKQKLERLKASNEIMQYLYETALNNSIDKNMPQEIDAIQYKDAQIKFVLKSSELVPYLQKNNIHCEHKVCTLFVDDLL